jgi:hypothetical protein
MPHLPLTDMFGAHSNICAPAPMIKSPISGDSIRKGDGIGENGL